MPDAVYAEPKIAELYDIFEGLDRPDLAPYLAMADEFHAHVVIDLGCGTGNLACRLAARGKEVVGIDPATASLSIAKRKADASLVRWITGTARQLQGLSADLIIMTGNVAQVFVTDEEWIETLRSCRDALRPHGRLVFETRDPDKEVWKSLNREQTYTKIEAPEIGTVESWVDWVNVQLPLVSFRSRYLFHKDGSTMTSESTLRFRTQSEVTETLSRAGLKVEAVRDAPDRPGQEFVFIAHQ